MTRDWHGLWAGRIINQRERLAVRWDSALGRLLALYWGVELGQRCRFFGRPLFRRATGSVIRIGENCQFRSTTWANPLSLDRPCMISTVYPEAQIIIGTKGAFSSIAICATKSIELGENVMCGANVTIMDSDFHNLDMATRHQPPTGRPVRIEDDVFIGLNTLVLKGVTIGRGSVIGAGSIVTRSIPPGVLAAGQPARVLRTL